MIKINQENIENYLYEKYSFSNISFAGEGWTSIAYVVDDLVFRFPKISIEDYKREEKVLSVVRPYCNIPIPEIKIINDEFDYSVHKCIKGRTWTMMEFEQLDAHKQDVFIEDCATFLFNLHSVPVELFEKKVPSKTKASKPKSLKKEEFYPLLLSKMSEEELDKLYDIYIKTINTSKPDLTVLHKDFCGKNSVIDENFRLIGVFDFGNSGVTDRTREFSFLYNPKYPTFLNKLLVSYEKLSNIKINIKDIKDYLLRSAINSLPELYDEALASIKGKALDSRVRRFRFFLDETI